MNILIPSYYNQFQCIGSECLNTCCRGWIIYIDSDSMQRYLSIEGELGDRLRETIDRKQKKFILKGTVCPLLNEEHLCDIHSALGQEALCLTCQSYPRRIDEYNELWQVNLEISCSEAARLIISTKDIMTFQFADEFVATRKVVLCSNEKVSDRLLESYFNIQSISIDILQAREVSLYKRMLANLLFIQKVQKAIDKNLNKEIESVIEQYSDKEYLSMVFSSLDTIQVTNELYYDLLFSLLHSEICRNMMSHCEKSQMIYNKYIANSSLAHLRELLQTYDAEYEQYMKDRTTEYEQYYVYMIYSEFLKSMKDRNVYKANVMIQIGFTLIKAIGMLTWIDQEKELSVTDHALIISIYAKTYLHSKKLYEDSYHLLSSSKTNQMAYQVALIKTNL